MDKTLKRSNKLIIQRKRKITFRRGILFLVILCSVLSTLCLKLPYFNINEILVVNNRVVSSDSVINLSGLLKGNNIFYINTRNIKNSLHKNPYILDIKIKRHLPNKVVFDVKERLAVFYFIQDSKYIILDDHAIILEVRNNVDNIDLVKIEGIVSGNIITGETLKQEENRKIDVLTQMSDLIKRNSSDVKLSKIDVTELSKINIYSSEMLIKIGSSFNMEIKLNKALNILSKQEFKGKKGYIDVSFQGDPVVYIEK